ncbi:RICIN domain-containing protein [Jatrophihabitans telluris]|uniref:RICIN domain-containing protein n=1 Tax=Jatrophihabitans telluris TaxID=2038343 RepID=A0ABY4QY07_9ACTN|nr:RICIN domain-containing protein [Jatrophihabitans telluris]UQX88420.1 RICIN domain-containing protein [Jatrophihabitans telluris]
MPIKRLLVFLSAAALALAAVLVPASPGAAVTTGNGSLVYSPAAGSSFDPAGTTYAKIIALKHSGTSNGRLLVTYDQLVLVNGVQIYPIYASDDGGGSWTHLSDVVPSTNFASLTLTSQPFLFEVPQTVGALAAGTILLAGNIMPADRSSSRLVVYKSTDHGATFSLLSTVDTGGPAVYDPSPTSTTTTVWEPSLNLDSNGNLVCYFSDERQKAGGILQAVSYRRSTDGGLTWGAEANVAAIPNQSDRPGMITVTKLPTGKYLATYEVVNRPSQSVNTAVVYYKFSDDGLTWTANSLGTAIKLPNGRGLGSSPFVRWVNAGGPNGMVVVSSKWAVDSAGNISGGQNFYVNYNLGNGPWERLPFATTYDASDSQGGTFAGFAQSFDVSPDGLTLYQATNVENRTTGYDDIRVGTVPLNAYHYEAERATLTHVSTVSQVDADNGSKIGNINYADSLVAFNHVSVPTAGTYTVNVRYDNGTGASSSQSVRVNGGTPFSVAYPKTVDWNRYGWAQFTATLNAGANTITFGYSGTYAELDAIDVYRTGLAANGEFRLANRNSGKYLEIASASTADGAPAGQWGDTDNPTQVWRIGAVSGGYTFTNLNSGKLLDVSGASTANGAAAIQNPAAGTASQRWTLAQTDSGFMTVTNSNSAKLLEIYQNSTADGAIADQWAATGFNCQQWQLVKEGIQ